MERLEMYIKGKLAGQVAYEYDKHFSEYVIFDLNVKKNYRRRGLGTRLMQRALINIEYDKTLHPLTKDAPVILKVEESNKDKEFLTRFYKLLGFEVESTYFRYKAFNEDI